MKVYNGRVLFTVILQTLPLGVWINLGSYLIIDEQQSNKQPVSLIYKSSASSPPSAVLTDSSSIMEHHIDNQYITSINQTYLCHQYRARPVCTFYPARTKSDLPLPPVWSGQPLSYWNQKWLTFATSIQPGHSQHLQSCSLTRPYTVGLPTSSSDLDIP